MALNHKINSASAATEALEKTTSRRFKPLFLTLLLIAALFVCLGWADSLDGLKTTTGKITSIQADFVQEKHLPILAKPLLSKGVLYFKAPSSLRWEYRSPIQSILLMHAGTTKRFQHDGNRFYEEKSANAASMDVIMAQISQWLSGDFKEDSLFNAQMDRTRHVVLTPKEKSMGQIIEHIELELAETAGVIKSVTIYEGPEAYTRMDFSQSKINAQLSDDIFQKVP